MKGLLWGLCSFAALSGGVAGSQGRAGEATQEAPVYPQSVREGLAARAGFETVPASRVPKSSPISGLRDRVVVTTHALDPDMDAYKVQGSGLDHLRSVTLVWPEEGSDSPFVLDLYVHGDLDDDQLAFRVPGLDIRKFLHQLITHLEGAKDLARLQAHFAEFSRKSKILYPLEKGSVEDGLVSPYEARAVEILRRDLRVLASEYADGSRRRESYERAIRRLRSGSARDLAIAHQNLDQAAGDLRDGAEAETRSLRLDEASRVEALTAKVLELAAARKISDLLLTNNCREPGNFEIVLRDSLGRPALKGAFLLPPEAYDRLLRQYTGLGIADQGTGVRVSETLRAIDPSVADPDGEGHAWARVLPRVSIGDLGVLRAAGTQSRRVCNGELQVETGLIPYSEYELEVRRKSAAVSGTYHPLSFVKVNPRVSPPKGFGAPDGEAAEIYWFEPENAGKAVPHRFLTFEDIRNYDVHLSGFEVNGVYIGRTDLESFNPERQEGRWPFDYSYLGHLRHFEIRQPADGAVEIRLLGNDVGGIHFVLGNVRLAVGEETQLQLGIGTQPLIAPYNDDVFRDPLPYNLAYGSDGLILDHHAPEIGVEQVYIERSEEPDQGAGHVYRIRLVSHERILPVWEGTIDAAAPGCELSP